MAKAKVKATRFTCDGCATEHLVDDAVYEPPEGYHGTTVLRVGPAGGDGCSDWYACSQECIVEAILTAIERANRPGDD